LFFFLTLLICAEAFQLPVSAYTSTNYRSTIDILDIDIAPSATPKVPRQQQPNEAPKQTQAIPNRTNQQAPREEAVDEVKRYFSISLSAGDLDFGVIDPTNPVIRTHQITVSAGNTHGYTLLGYENHTPQAANKSVFIHDTSCDDGTCTETTAAPWLNTLTYGFGFRCDKAGNDVTSCMPEFQKPEHFKQLGDVSKQESGAFVLRSAVPGQNSQARITYKLNIPGTQAKQAYTNALVFIATPRF
jgi:hypothetical protein